MISVIIPVYNVEEYLPECLDSVLAQTYRDLEIIIVDDGSTDRSPRICDDYAEKDSRIRVIHQENGGLSAARNTALDAASGDYIGFVDSDDHIAEDMFETLLEACVSEEADVACCGYYSYGGEQELSETVVEREMKLSWKDAIKEFLAQRMTMIVMWNKLYRSRLFDAVRFPEGEIHEDNAVYYKVIGESDRVVFIKRSLYYHRRRAGSIATTGSLAVHRAVIWKDLIAQRDYMEERAPEVMPSLKDYLAAATYELMAMKLRGDADTLPQDTVNELNAQFRSMFSYMVFHSGFPASKRFKTVLMRMKLYAPSRTAYMKLRGSFRPGGTKKDR